LVSIGCGGAFFWIMGLAAVLKGILGGYGRLGLGFESLSLASMSLAKPIACEMENGLRIASSWRISGMSPEIKQLRRASCGRPKTRFPNRSKLFWYSATDPCCLNLNNCAWWFS